MATTILKNQGSNIKERVSEMEKNSSCLGGWIRIRDADIKEWNDKMDLKEITKTGAMFVDYADSSKPLYCSQKNSDCCIYHGIWYTESREFLLSCGIKPIHSLAISGKDVTSHDDLPGDNIYQPQTYETENFTEYFYGSNTPVLLTQKPSLDEKNIDIILWSTNTVKNMHFSGCALVNENTLKPYFEYVRKMFQGTLTKEQLEHFLQGVPIKPKEIFKYEPLPTREFIEKQIISLGLKKWFHHRCSLCNYPCGYIFDVTDTEIDTDNKNNKKKVVVRYDAGCYCMHQLPRPSDVDDIIDHISIQTNRTHVEKMRKFWETGQYIEDNKITDEKSSRCIQQ